MILLKRMKPALQKGSLARKPFNCSNDSARDSLLASGLRPWTTLRAAHPRTARPETLHHHLLPRRAFHRLAQLDLAFEVHEQRSLGRASPPRVVGLQCKKVAGGRHRPALAARAIDEAGGIGEVDQFSLPMPWPGSRRRTTRRERHDRQKQRAAGAGKCRRSHIARARLGVAPSVDFSVNLLRSHRRNRFGGELRGSRGPGPPFQ